MSTPNENPEGSPQILGGSPSSPHSQAKLCAAKQALVLSGKDRVLPTDSETLALKTTTAMAYSAPGRYAGVLQALETLLVHIDTVQLLCLGLSLWSAPSTLSWLIAPQMRCGIVID